MFNTRLEVLQHINNQYAQATGLSKKATGHCVYSHDVNGIGCPIGSCVSPEDAKALDGIKNKNYDNQRICELIRDLRSRPILAKYFNLDVITASDLQQIQTAHDDMGMSITSFRAWLKTAIRNAKRTQS